MAEIELNKNATGFGLYDRRFVEILGEVDDPYPYFRGLISEIGFPVAKIAYRQPLRQRGVTSNNFYRLYDMAMLGITNHSKVPLRLATMLGFAVSLLSLLIAMGYLVFKLLYWDRFTLGLAPLVIGLFFFGSVQLFFIGILGEYIGAIHTQVQKRPPRRGVGTDQLRIVETGGCSRPRSGLLVGLIGGLLGRQINLLAGLFILDGQETDRGDDADAGRIVLRNRLHRFDVGLSRLKRNCREICFPDP